MPLSIGVGCALALLVSRGLRGAPLLVPTKILPPDIVGPPYDSAPSFAAHFTFFFVSFLRVSHSSGMFFSMRLTMLRDGVPPKVGQSRTWSAAGFSPACNGPAPRVGF